MGFFHAKNLAMLVVMLIVVAFVPPAGALTPAANANEECEAAGCTEVSGSISGSAKCEPAQWNKFPGCNSGTNGKWIVLYNWNACASPTAGVGELWVNVDDGQQATSNWKFGANCVHLLSPHTFDSEPMTHCSDGTGTGKFRTAAGQLEVPIGTPTTSVCYTPEELHDIFP